MRSTSKATLGVITLGILAGSFQAGLATQTAKQNLAESLSASGQSGSASIDTGGDATAPESEVSAPAPAASATAESTPAQPAAGQQSTTVQPVAPTQPTASAQPKATKPAAPSNPSNGNSGTASATGDAIYYRYGTIQVEVVKTDKSITAINLLQASTKGREYQTVPSILVNAALSSQGTGFGNVSGATFTSEAFRSALESALGKL